MSAFDYLLNKIGASFVKALINISVSTFEQHVQPFI